VHNIRFAAVLISIPLFIFLLLFCVSSHASSDTPEPIEYECLVLDYLNEPVQWGESCFDVDMNGVVNDHDLSKVKIKLIQNINGTFFYEYKDMLGDVNRKPYLLNGHVLWVDFEDMQIIECELIRLGIVPYNNNPACLVQ
jgi:hypothetical protein